MIILIHLWYHPVADIKFPIPGNILIISNYITRWSICFSHQYSKSFSSPYLNSMFRLTRIYYRITLENNITFSNWLLLYFILLLRFLSNVHFISFAICSFFSSYLFKYTAELRWIRYRKWRFNYVINIAEFTNIVVEYSNKMWVAFLRGIPKERIYRQMFAMCINILLFDTRTKSKLINIKSCVWWNRKSRTCLFIHTTHIYIQTYISVCVIVNVCSRANVCI